MTGEPQCAVGVPNVGPFGDPLLLVELAVAAEEHGWDGFFVWDHLLYHDQHWNVADPVAVSAAVAARAVERGMLPRAAQRPRIRVWGGARWPNPAPFSRAARWDAVMPSHGGYGLGETMAPNELRAVVQYPRQHRTEDGPFDVILEGR